MSRDVARLTAAELDALTGADLWGVGDRLWGELGDEGGEIGDDLQVKVELAALTVAVGLAAGALLLRGSKRNGSAAPADVPTGLDAPTADAAPPAFCMNLFPKGGDIEHACADGRDACDGLRAQYLADPRYNIVGSCEAFDQARTPTVWTDVDRQRVFDVDATDTRSPAGAPGGSKRCGNSWIPSDKTCHKR